MGACTHRLRRVPGGLSAAIADGLRAAAFGGGVGARAADGDDDAGEGCTVDSTHSVACRFVSTCPRPG
eukprot:5411747-Prymnesium_polylepis.1